MLIRNLFAEEARIRISSARDLIAGWRDDAGAVQLLVKFASENLDNSNGVFNTVVVLNEFSSDALLANKGLLLDFIEQAKLTGPKTGKKVNALAKRLE